MKSIKLTKADLKQLTIFKNTMMFMWEAGAKTAGRDPKKELGAFGSGWDAALEAIKILRSR